ncbi:MAG: 6-bladed beta-propeller [Rhodothermaceae bacterium]|nr:6-bladed beta-propeller [Bacteroidota bacterium]MXW32612.1 6-bladed beta-propeller [Rhodothermaceae bacterium]MYC03230.1 6-bladed beta-propeller [Rhodothermaceae bacterium]MYE64186.1 6-bladed beta-propeller [Rhodothermaceae bacterium]MYI16155.1 6-bladed beta-propeller [Rhodothermaceae bacterium]
MQQESWFYPLRYLLPVLNQCPSYAVLDAVPTVPVDLIGVLKSVAVRQMKEDVGLEIQQFIRCSVMIELVLEVEVASSSKVSYMGKLCVGVGLVTTLSLVSCEVEEGDTRFRFGQLYLDRLTEQSVSERNFLEVSYEKLFTIPDTTDMFLYELAPASVDSLGNIYLIDWGIDKVIKFSPSGEYLVTYGESGTGEGPGEFLNITDFEVTSDSIVYVVDTYGRKVVSFSIDGTFLQEKKLKHQPFGYQIAATGQEYTVFSNGPTLLESRLGDEVFEIISLSDLVDEGKEGFMEFTGLFGGNIVTYYGNVVYVFVHYPLILKYEPDGTLVYARTTLGYKDDFKEPEVETLMLGGMPATRNVARAYHTGYATVENDKIFVLGISPSEAPDKTIVIDVYDVRTGDYQHSMFPPEDGLFYTIYQNGRIYQAKDSIVVAWKVVY